MVLPMRLYAAGRAINKLVRLAVPIENRLDTRGLDVYQRQQILKSLEGEVQSDQGYPFVMHRR